VAIMAIVPLLLMAPLVYAAPLSLFALVLCLVYVVRMRAVRMADINPTDAMRRAARRIAEIMPARFVVMGHTHEPVYEHVDERTVYVNVGNWGVDEMEENALQAHRTHLVLRWVGHEMQAEFRRWCTKARAPEPRALEVRSTPTPVVPEEPRSAA
jgi:hypothetical protein